MSNTKKEHTYVKLDDIYDIDAFQGRLAIASHATNTGITHKTNPVASGDNPVKADSVSYSVISGNNLVKEVCVSYPYASGDIAKAVYKEMWSKKVCVSYSGNNLAKADGEEMFGEKPSKKYKPMNFETYANIRYNYFHDFWDDLVVDTGFINIKGMFVNGAFVNGDTVAIIFEPDHKINQVLTKVMNHARENMDKIISNYNPHNNGKDGTINVIETQKTPRYHIKFGKKNNNCIFLGSKTKNFENTNITNSAQLRKMYYSNITDCRLIIKPKILKFNKHVLITMNITRSEFKYSNACVQSEIDKKTNRIAIINDTSSNSSNIIDI